jgi:hypothetical protein
MKGDFSRKTFDKRKYYSRVLQQQGRVNLDSDYNEQIDILHYIERSFVKDIIGPCGAPKRNAGFKIIPIKGGYKIGSGHYYVDGISCDSVREVTALSQPDLPPDRFDKSPAVPQYPGIYLIYLDVWERHITALNDPDILEPALGGADTTTRTKIVWQVKAQLVSKSIDHQVRDCEERYDIPNDMTSGKMRAQINSEKVQNDNSNTLNFSDYTRSENYLYRVEIHDSGETEFEDPPSFKWSKHNGSIVARASYSVKGEQKRKHG